MKQLTILLLLLPLLSSAQKNKTEETNKPNDGKLTLVHADKTVTVPAAKKENSKNTKDDIIYYGSVEFKIGSNLIQCDSAHAYENDGIVKAYNITLSAPGYFTTKGSELEFNRKTLGGTINRDITVTALNGSVIGKSETVEVDLKTESYRIGMGSIAPPDQAK